MNSNIDIDYEFYITNLFFKFIYFLNRFASNIKDKIDNNIDFCGICIYVSNKFDLYASNRIIVRLLI